MDQEGWWQKHGCHDNVILEYFEQIFIISSGDGDISFLDHMEHKFIEEMDAQLSTNFNAKEIGIALHSMHPTKASGLDGMTLIFFQKYWDVVGSEITKANPSTLNTSIFLHAFNDTYIILIQKKMF